MIVHTQKLELAQEHCLLIYRWLRSKTVQPYQRLKLSQGYAHSHELNVRNAQLMEGFAVPPHDDGVPAWRPILVLNNPGSNYIFRGVSSSGEVQACSAQKPGTLLILDISKQHEVYSADPNGDYGPWAGLVWGDQGRYCLKEDWGNDLDMVKQAAWEKISWMTDLILDEVDLAVK